MWIKRTNANGLEYGGSQNYNYWNLVERLFKGKYVLEYALPNCTILCIGRCLENGLPKPVYKDVNANLWHTQVNIEGGWTLLQYVEGMNLKGGDIVEWEANHVAIVEEDGTNPLVSASWWTNYDGTSKGARYNNPICNTLKEISDYFLSKYDYRFYHSVPLSTENAQGGNKKSPKYVIRYAGDIEPNGRDIYANQIFVKTNEQRLRKEPNTNSQILGLLKNGYYTITSSKQMEDYTWYKIDGGYVAKVEGRVEYIAKQEIPQTEKVIKELQEAINKLNQSYKEVVENNENLHKQVDELKPYKEQINKIKEIVK